MIKPELIEGLGFQGVNSTWNAVHVVLDEAFTVEMETAISRETSGEDRIHAAGRAEALNDFKLLLMQLRQESLRAQGVMVDSKSG